MSYPQQPGPYPQNWHPHQGQPAQSYGWIAVTARYQPLAWSMVLYRPKLFVDGYEMPTAGWGRTVVPAWPGRRHVHVHAAALGRQAGKADTVVDVYPGRLVELEYKAPALADFTPGSLGYPRQS